MSGYLFFYPLFKWRLTHSTIQTWNKTDDDDDDGPVFIIFEEYLHDNAKRTATLCGKEQEHIVQILCTQIFDMNNKQVGVVFQWEYDVGLLG